MLHALVLQHRILFHEACSTAVLKSVHFHFTVRHDNNLRHWQYDENIWKLQIPKALCCFRIFFYNFIKQV